LLTAVTIFISVASYALHTPLFLPRKGKDTVSLVY
jgi:hypothetical protein